MKLRWLLAIVLLPALGAAQQPLAPRLPGLIVRLRTKSGATAFLLGARIQLVVSFQSSIPGRYSIGLSDGKRSQCSVSEPVVSSGSGWHDPLAALKKLQRVYSLDCLMGGGPLSMQAVTQTLDLNQWVRFDQPGHYIVTVHTQAIGLSRAGTPFGSGHFHVISEPLRLKIIAPPSGWYAAQLEMDKAELVAILARGKPVDAPDLSDAIQKLAALGGPEAAGALAALWTHGYPYALDALAEAGAPRAALAALQAEIRDPAQALNRNLLGAAVTFRLLAKGETWRASQAENRALQAEVAQLLPGKVPAALARSLAAVLTFYPPDFPASARAWLTEALADHFDELPAGQQMLCMEYLAGPHDPLAGPAELAFVRRVAQMPLTGPDAGMARAAALHRWYDLAPREARFAVIAAIEDGSAAGWELEFLPDKTLPQADQPLLNELGAPPNTAKFDAAVRLIERYASAAIAPAVALELNAQGARWPCDSRHLLVQYLERVQPKLAAPAQQIGEQPWGQNGGCGWK